MQKNPINYPLSLDAQPGSDAACCENFYRKVRRIDALNPSQPRTGHAVVPREEKVRFRQIPHLRQYPQKDPQHDKMRV